MQLVLVQQQEKLARILRSRFLLISSVPATLILVLNSQSRQQLARQEQLRKHEHERECECRAHRVADRRFRGCCLPACSHVFLFFIKLSCGVEVRQAKSPWLRLFLNNQFKNKGNYNTCYNFFPTFCSVSTSLNTG